MSSKRANKHPAATEAIASRDKVGGNGERETVIIMVNGKPRTIVMPSDEEDKAIIAGALRDPDAQPLTSEQLDEFQPARRRGRPASDITKIPTSIRFDTVVLDSFKSLGDGWQTRMNSALREYLVTNDMMVHRFHATVQRREDELLQVFECVVVAKDDGQAKEKVKQHLRKAGREADARGQVFTVEVGNAVLKELPLLM